METTTSYSESRGTTFSVGNPLLSERDGNYASLGLSTYFLFVGNPLLSERDGNYLSALLVT